MIYRTPPKYVNMPVSKPISVALTLYNRKIAKEFESEVKDMKYIEDLCADYFTLFTLMKSVCDLEIDLIRNQPELD
jgi:hypothetical protein